MMWFRQITNMPALHHLHLQLRETDPVIWRRIQVPADFALEDLHDVIQIIFGNWMAGIIGRSGQDFARKLIIYPFLTKFFLLLSNRFWHESRVFQVNEEGWNHLVRSMVFLLQSRRHLAHNLL